MTDLLLSLFRYCGARSSRRTIGQEGHRGVTLVREIDPGPANDADLIPLDDAAIGQEGLREKRATRARSVR
jgi:hypothetical protein